MLCALRSTPSGCDEIASTCWRRLILRATGELPLFGTSPSLTQVAPFTSAVSRHVSCERLQRVSHIPISLGVQREITHSTINNQH